MRISDWSSDVCSSDLHNVHAVGQESCRISNQVGWKIDLLVRFLVHENQHVAFGVKILKILGVEANAFNGFSGPEPYIVLAPIDQVFQFDLHRSEEHTSELQSLMRISYAVFFLKKKTKR